MQNGEDSVAIEIASRKNVLFLYAACIKRILDFSLALFAIVIFSPVLMILSLLGLIIMKGNPFFLQYRPGRMEKIFPMLKFRSMTNEKDDQGRLLPDQQRLTAYGRFIRATSLDELPEFFNILAGHMSFVGPRPQLVRDMVFMTPEQRRRHSVRPGLTGLAQASGRNALRWENKLALDLEYVKNITFRNDLKIVLKTARVIIFGSDCGSEETEITEDFGDYLLQSGEIDQAEYAEKQKLARELLGV